MTTSISSVNAGSTAASEVATKKSTLSSETKAKLEALGITATDGMTESEAKAKIAQAEAENNSQNQNNQQQGNVKKTLFLTEPNGKRHAILSTTKGDGRQEAFDQVYYRLHDRLAV